MKNLARFFSEKVDSVSDFEFHLKKRFMFHVLAEFFAQGFEVWNEMEWKILRGFFQKKWIMYQILSFIWKSSLCFMFWLNFSRKNFIPFHSKMVFFARFFLKKVNNVSDFDFHLKNAITFHVLAEIFFLLKNESKWVL